MPPSLRRVSSGRKRSKLIHRATSGVKRRAWLPTGAAGVAPFAMTFLRRRGEGEAPGVGPYTLQPTERPASLRSRSYEPSSVQVTADRPRSKDSSSVALVQAAARTADRLPSNRVIAFAQPRQDIAARAETDAARSLPAQQPERGPALTRHRPLASSTALVLRHAMGAALSPAARARSGIETDGGVRPYAPATALSGEPAPVPLSDQDASAGRDILLRSTTEANGTGLRGPDTPVEQTDTSAHERPMIGAIHLDGNALGQWMTRHLERTLSQPNRGPSGVDPRVIPTWGPLSAAY